MGVYEPLTRHLRSRSQDTWSTSFSEIEKLLQRPLPKSAYEHRPWWANQSGGNHSQSRAWRDAGWETRDVDLKRGTVRFERRQGRSDPEPGAVRSLKPDPDLWEQARRLSGIEADDELIEAALTALIRREAARQLIAMGGTMPDFTVPPRERPTW